MKIGSTLMPGFCASNALMISWLEWISAGLFDQKDQRSVTGVAARAACAPTAETRAMHSARMRETSARLLFTISLLIYAMWKTSIGDDQSAR